MAPKTKQASGQGATMGSSSEGSYSLPGGVFSLSPPELPEVSPRDGRKKRKGVLSREKYTLTPYFDGHLWRKYGQKRIKNSPFPRLYFRCSYNEDKHCMASKLMQQVSHDYPPMYKVTYMYEHTCNAAPIPAPDVVAEAELPAASSDGLVLRFGGSHGSGDNRRDLRMQQERRREYNQQPSSSNWSPFELLGFDSWNSQVQQPVLSSDIVLPAPAAVSSSSPFSIAQSSSSPTLPATNDDSEGDVLATWNSVSYGVDEGHVHLENHADFAGDMFSWDTNLDAHLHGWSCTGIEGEEILF